MKKNIKNVVLSRITKITQRTGKNYICVVDFFYYLDSINKIIKTISFFSFNYQKIIG